MTIEQVLGLNNRAVFFINEARYLLAIPPLVRCARCDEWTSALTCAACVGTVRQDER